MQVQRFDEINNNYVPVKELNLSCYCTIIEEGDGDLYIILIDENRVIKMSYLMGLEGMYSNLPDLYADLEDRLFRLYSGKLVLQN